MPRTAVPTIPRIPAEITALTDAGIDEELELLADALDQASRRLTLMRLEISRRRRASAAALAAATAAAPLLEGVA